MKSVLADERGRITLGTEIVDKYGKKFAVVNTRKQIVLVPIAKNPIARLSQIGKEAGIDRYTLVQLRRMARQEAEKELRH